MYSVFLKYIIFLFGTQILIINSAADRLSKYGYSDDHEGVSKLLKNLNNDYDADLINDLIRKLESNDFAVREKATFELSQIPLLDREAIKLKLDGFSLEQKTRLQRVLKENSHEKFIRLLIVMNESIVENKYKGLLKELWKSTDRVKSEQYSNLWDMYRDASIETSVNDDVDLIKNSVLSDNGIIRYSTIPTLIKLLGNESESYLLKLVNDNNDQIKWAISEALMKFQNPQCLIPLVDLLICDQDFGLRWRSLEALRKLTGQEFGYYAAGNADDRKEPAKKWRKWVNDNLEIADLNFNNAASNEVISLFNGINLDDWIERPLDGFLADGADGADGVNDGWEATDGMILTKKGKRSALVHKISFLNYELNFEYKLLERSSDSGIGIFVGDNNKGYLEVQLYPNRSGDLYKIGSDVEFKLDDENMLRFSSRKFKEGNEENGKWNKMNIKIINGQAEISINGEIQNRAFNDQMKPSKILLRNEGSSVGFKNLIVKKL